ncbi:MAG: YopX family protein [Ruminococcus sp.]|nr:YopX family protein [Ruminococcus sp.]
MAFRKDMKIMNREILYRGLHRRKGEKVRLNGESVESKWVYGGVCQFKGERSIIYQTEPEITKFPVYTETIGQYTGLTDRNGVKIFEGDIIEGFDEKENRSFICVVEYDDCSAAFYAMPNDINIFISFSDIDCGDITVLGNIYDNPELLEGELK